MTNILNKGDLSKLKEIGLNRIVDGFGDVLGCNIGGDSGSIQRGRMYIRDILNEISQSIDPDNHIHLFDEDDE